MAPRPVGVEPHTLCGGPPCVRFRPGLCWNRRTFAPETPRQDGRYTTRMQGTSPLDDPVLHVVLYQPEIAHNTGAVGRTCVAVGAKLWLVRPLGFRLDDRHLRRAGLDYWQHLAWEAVDDWDALWRRLAGPSPWLFSKKADRSYTDARFRRGDVLVFGSESKGLPDSLLESHRPRTLRIPVRREARSLNLSVSVGIVAFEARRQIATGP